MLKGKYEVLKSVGFVDLGFNWREQNVKERFAYVDLGGDVEGALNPEEIEKLQKSLYTIAINSGAKALVDDKGIKIGLNTCLDFSGVTAPKDDLAIVLNKGDKLMVTTRYKDAEGNINEVKPEELTVLSFDQLHWLEDNGFIG
jgi:hypothetical protein